MANRILVFIYGAACYTMFLGVFLYALGFVGNLFQYVDSLSSLKSMDAEADGPLGTAVLINTLLLGLFAVQHSVMARPAFKRQLTQFIPEPAERSTYVLLSNLAMILLFWQWRPIGGIVWDVQNSTAQIVLWSLFAFGWSLVLVTTFLINHFDLFGLRQIWLYLLGKEYTPLKFKTHGLYRMIRHPLYVGWMIAFWATPTMTIAHLVFAIATTAYMLIAIQLEERDLVTFLGEDYAQYRTRVPMLIPRLFKR